MKKTVYFSLLLILFISTSSFVVHKFYVAIFQIEENAQKNRLEITSRIFIDDLNITLEKKFNKKFDLEKIDSENTEFVKKYITRNFIISVNGEQKNMTFKSLEIENNVLICYYTINTIPKIKSIAIENSILTETFEEQQNIIQAHFNNNRQSLLLTAEKTKGMLK
jgi:hypothetical protein